MHILFFGSPEFAVPSLKKLNDSRHKVLGVVTKPDKPKGRGRKLKGTPVKEFADKIDLPVYQPEDLNSKEFINFLKKCNADLFVVVGFTILSERIINIPKNGAINLHASLLPAYRGAAPIQWALMNGEKETGVTTFFLNKRVDSGEIILQERIKINMDDTAGTLYDKLSLIGSDIILKSVDLIENGNVTTYPQKGEVTKAPKITPEILVINWENSAYNVINKIRAFSPFPGTCTFLDEKRVKIFNASIKNEHSNKVSGTIISVNGNSITTACKENCIEFREIQMQGKRRMAVAEFLRGYQIIPGTVFGQNRTDDKKE